MSKIALPPDPYLALSVDKIASDKEIRTAYRRLVLTTHPDKFPDPDVKAKKQDEFQKLQEAYELLTDEAERSKYDDLVKLLDLRERNKAAQRAAAAAATAAAASAPSPSPAAVPSPASGVSPNMSVPRTPRASPYYEYDYAEMYRSGVGVYAQPYPPTRSWDENIATSRNMFDDEVRRPRRTASYDKPTKRDDDQRRRRKVDDDDDVRDKEKRRAKKSAEKERSRDRRKDADDKARRKAYEPYVEDYDNLDDAYPKKKAGAPAAAATGGGSSAKSRDKSSRRDREPSVEVDEVIDLSSSSRVKSKSRADKPREKSSRRDNRDSPRIEIYEEVTTVTATAVSGDTMELNIDAAKAHMRAVSGLGVSSAASTPKRPKRAPPMPSVPTPPELDTDDEVMRRGPSTSKPSSRRPSTQDAPMPIPVRLKEQGRTASTPSSSRKHSANEPVIVDKLKSTPKSAGLSKSASSSSSHHKSYSNPPLAPGPDSASPSARGARLPRSHTSVEPDGYDRRGIPSMQRAQTWDERGGGGAARSGKAAAADLFEQPAYGNSGRRSDRDRDDDRERRYHVRKAGGSGARAVPVGVPAMGGSSEYLSSTDRLSASPKARKLSTDAAADYYPAGVRIVDADVPVASATHSGFTVKRTPAYGPGDAKYANVNHTRRVPQAQAQASY